VVKLARQAGMKDMYATVVHEKDRYRYWEDDSGRHYELERTQEDDPGKVKCVISRAVLEDGSISLTETPWIKIKKIRDQALTKTRGTGPWCDWPEEMMIKTGLKQGCKTLPQSDNLAAALSADDGVEIGIPAAVPEEMIGAVDAEYKELVDESREAAKEEPAAEAPKPESKAPVPEAVNQFRSKVLELADAAGKVKNVDGIILAEFGYASLEMVQEKDFEPVLTHFKSLQPKG
jgi:recombinational DNA repair protein RecT